MTEVTHNMNWKQTQDWLATAENKELTNNEVRIWILLNLVHDGWLGINAAFAICEKFGVFTKSYFNVANDFSKFRNGEK